MAMHCHFIRQLSASCACARGAALLLACALALTACGGPQTRTTVPAARASSLPVTPRILQSDRHLQCVPYARQVSQVALRGDADTWWDKAAGRYARGHHPAVGAVLVLKPRGGSRGHIAVVTAVLSEREIVVEHANWLNRGDIHLDTPVIDVSRDGDWSAVKVWYTPGGVYGVRTYPVQGFIYPASAS